MKKKLQEELRAVMGQLKTYRDIAEPTDEQTTQYDANLDLQEQLLAKIAECDAREARAIALEAQARTSVNPLPAGNPAPLPGGGPAAPSGRSIVIPATARRKAPKAFETAEQAYAFGQYCRAVFGGNAQARQWLSEHGYPLNRAQTEGDNTAGGYLVPHEFGGIIESLIPQYGITRQFANVVPMARDTKSHPKTPALLMMRPAGELDTVTNDTIRFPQIELVARKWMLILQASSELSEDAAISIADQMSSTIAKSAAYTEDICLWRADGTSTYNSNVGVFNALNNVSSNAGVVTLTSVSTYLGVTKEQLIDIVGKLNPAAADFGDLAWYCTHKGKLEMFYRIALAQGGSTANEIVSSPNPTFLGYPIRVSNAIQENEATGGFPLAFGSLNAAVLFGDRRELTLVNSMEAGFLTDSEYWRATERFALNVHETGDSTTAGPLVVAKFG